MRKIAIISAIAVLGAVSALAASVSVPWFVDNTTITNVDQISTLGVRMGFIALHNNTGSDIECAIVYVDRTGSSVTPTANTFTIPGNATWSFRPVQTDAGNEGVATAVPNISAGDSGSCSISWTGSATDIQGRYMEYGPHGQAGYLLPPGA